MATMHRLASWTGASLCALVVVACKGVPPGGATHASSSSTAAASSGSGGAGGAGGAGSGGAQETGGAGGAGGSTEAGTGGGSPDGGAACSVEGTPGQCMEVAACAAMPGYSSTPGYCPGPADVECCTMTPSVADNPPTPTGYQLMAQADVTPAMTSWAVSILDDPTDYPMFSTAMMTFGTQPVLALVEWHPPDFQNDVVHRGVTLFEPN